jgi:gamma-glutamyltranspeptidase/glutathione hydrolase
MVVSTSSIASQIGVDILKQGGNAIDASIATAFALAVTHPAAGNIGGGGFIVFMNSEGEVTTIDFREKAPLAATPTMFQDEDGNLITGLNHLSHLAIGVPGTVAGLCLAHDKYGKLKWSELVQPAIDLAKNGFPLPWGLYREALAVDKMDRKHDILINYFRNSNGEIIKPGELWRQPALARTLEYIRDKGRDGFYKGVVAKEIAAYMRANGGLITEKDLKRYDAIERPPLTGTFREYQIYSMPLPSSGGIAIIEMLNIWEQADISTLEFNSTSYVHFLAETMRRAYADRAEFLGDPDFNPDIPVDRLISKEHAKSRYAHIDMVKASVSDSSRFGHPYDGDQTTHFSVIDEAGNAVSLTYTLEHSYGSGMGSSKLGFIFNNEMGDFNPVPGVTTAKGQIGSAPNTIAPEKRMLSSMTPTIVAKNGKPYLIVGSPGGRTIINTVFQTILNVLAYDMRSDKAVEALKIHHQWLPDEIRYEEHLLSPDTRDALMGMGHKLRGVSNLGELMVIGFDESLNAFIGAADSASKEGAAIGY